MKTLKSTTFMLMIAMVIASCNSESELEIYSLDTVPNESFTADVIAQQVSFSKGLNTNQRVYFEGQGVSNSLGYITVEMSHVQGAGQELTITDGEFTIRNYSGDEISGNYTGNGQLDDLQQASNQQWVVEQGMEEFQGAQGTLNVDISSIGEVEKGGYLVGEITGNITFSGIYK